MYKKHANAVCVKTTCYLNFKQAVHSVLLGLKCYGNVVVKYVIW
jgi:hypothetical protein